MSILVVADNLSIYAQATHGVGALGNRRLAATDFLGWDGLGVNPGPLDIRNDFADNINFRTGPGQFLRMLMRDGGAGNNAGRIAMGNNLPDGFIPRSRLHLHQTGGNVRLQFTRNNVGNLGSDGFQLGITGVLNTPANPYHAYINHREDAPIKIFTTNTERMHINADNSLAMINGFDSVNTSGYVGIGLNTTGPFPNGIWNDAGPFTLLHLNGAGSISSNSALGYLPWMQTGITLTDNNDLSYFGLRDVAGTVNVTETTILWSNDLAVGQEDDMVFRFARVTGTSAGSGAGDSINTTNLSVWDDLDGRHIARFTGGGRFALGPTFGRGNAAYVLPASMFHMSTVDTNQNWMQITNRGGTAETALDGLRIGITDTGTAHIKQQENLPLLFYTNNVENVRIEPDTASTMSGNVGKVGIGDWTTAQNLANPIDAKLDIDGDLRIRQVTKDTNNSRLVLVIDTTDLNRVHYLDLDSLPANVIANNGVSVDTAGVVQLGVPCRDSLGNPNDTAIQANVLTEDRVVAFRNHHLWFASLNADTAGVGIGGQPAFAPFCETGNTLEISANSKNPRYGSTAASGLRFTKLLSTSPVVPDSLYGIDPTKVLSVDSAGDVILINATANFGSICTNPTPVQLLDDSQVDLNLFEFHFSGTGGTQQENNVGIGTNCLNPLAGKLHVYRNSASDSSTAVYILNSDDAAPATGGASVGLYVRNNGAVIDPTAFYTVGGWFEANEGVPGAFPGAAIVVPQNGGFVQIGFDALNTAAFNTEPYLTATPASNELLSVNGDIYANGFTIPSDLNFKTNITPISDALNKVKSLNGVYFDYISHPTLNFSTDRQVGLIAQNVDTVLTEVTKYDSTLQAFTLDYAKINALLIEAIKEQSNKMDSLENENNLQDSINNDLENRLLALENCINSANICNTQARAENNEGEGTVIELENLIAIILDQNMPNPFKDKTVIIYTIPEEVVNAQLLFYDMNGRIIKDVTIDERGEGKLTVYGENLKNGIYTYSLIADGELIATKRMVKSK